jgi:hypothetical protein
MCKANIDTKVNVSCFWLDLRTKSSDSLYTCEEALYKNNKYWHNIIRCKALSSIIHNFCVGKITKLGKQLPKPVTVIQVCAYTRRQNCMRKIDIEVVWNDCACID